MKKLVFLLLLPGLLWADRTWAAANVYPTGPKEVNVGQTFNVAFVVSGAKDVDTIRLNGNYTQDLLELKLSQPAGVFQNVSPGTYSNPAMGIFSFGAFTLSSKANGTQRIAVLTFRAKKAGDAYVQLGTSSRLLSAGEEQIGSVGRLNIKITEKAPVAPEQPLPIPSVIKPGEAAISLFSTSHPDPNAWYTANEVLVGWKIEGKEAKTVYIGFDQDPQGPAEKLASDSFAKLIAPKDGVWYAHLGVSFKDKTYQRTDLRIQIDRQKPHPIQPIADQTGIRPSIPNTLRFGTLDDVSGIARYDVFLDGVFATSTQEQSYDLKGLAPGIHIALVKAYDRAGNMVEGSTNFSLIAEQKPSVPVAKWTLWDNLKVLFFSLFAVLFIIFLLIWDRKRREEKGKKRLFRRK
jgi:hypothetical protein